MSDETQTLALTAPDPAPQSTSIEKIPDPADNLSRDQRDVLQAFTNGHTISSAAGITGISRASIYRWIKSDPDFRALHHQWLDSIRQSCKSRLMNIAHDATITVESAIKHGDAKIAAQILKGMGLLTGKAEEPTCAPDQLQREDDVKKLEEEIDLLQRELKALRRKAELFGTGATATWSVVPEAIVPNSIIDLYNDIFELRRPFSVAGTFDKPWILIQCLTREDQIDVMARLSDLGYETHALYGFQEPIDPNTFPDRENPTPQDTAKWSAPDQILVKKT